MSIFNMVGCGGGSSLNYEVVDGTSAPSSPSVNTIWINTSTAITSHIFSATQPTNPASGMVWIIVGASSTAAFSATEENPVMVYPLSAKQYISGAWVDKTAQSYQGGEWVGWVTFVFQNGAFTNGGYGKQLGDSNCVVEIRGGELYICANSPKTTRFWTANKYDVTGKKELVFVVSQMINANPDGIGTWHFGISKTQNDDTFVAEVSVTGKNDNAKKEYKVSLPPDGGIYYVKVVCVRTKYYRDEAFIQEIRLQ